jgi:hypothetical protein
MKLQDIRTKAKGYAEQTKEDVCIYKYEGEYRYKMAAVFNGTAIEIIRYRPKQIKNTKVSRSKSKSAQTDKEI